MPQSAAYRRERRKRKLSEGKCPACMARKPVAGKTTCETCLGKIAGLGRSRERVYRLRGRCTVCGEPAAPGRRRCRRHLLRENLWQRSARALDAGRACPLTGHWCQDEELMTIFRRLYTSKEDRCRVVSDDSSSSLSPSSCSSLSISAQ